MPSRNSNDFQLPSQANLWRENHRQPFQLWLLLVKVLSPRSQTSAFISVRMKCGGYELSILISFITLTIICFFLLLLELAISIMLHCTPDVQSGRNFSDPFFKIFLITSQRSIFLLVRLPPSNFFLLQLPSASSAGVPQQVHQRLMQRVSHPTNEYVHNALILHPPSIKSMSFTLTTTESYSANSFLLLQLVAGMKWGIVNRSVKKELR